MESHVRIDEGVKRGSRPPKHQHQPPKVKRDGQSPTIPAGLDPDAILELYLSAETTSEIAAQLGVRRHALVRWLRTQRPEQWRQVQAIRAICRKDDGEEGVAEACDALSLARARELLRAGQWELERLDRDYAPRQPMININAEGPLQVQVVSWGSMQPSVETNAAPQLLQCDSADESTQP